ncbi:SIS domain-containing protein [Candidatus Micrarchaeota archaeon]|jgi:fructoselysine-6-phosphate deglycase|nr:SIS domain-containing protein [Candidatus Micrarchaeota archaeon]
MDLRNFDLKKYNEEAETAYGKRGEIEAMADKLHRRGYNNIVVMGIGGTWAEWHPVVHVMRHYTDLPIYLENAAELCIKKDKRFLTKDSLVITASASGNTKEILEAVKMCKEKGIEVAGFSKDENTPLAKELDYLIANPCGDCEHSYLMFFMLALKLLNNRGEFKNYEKFADQMKNIHKNLIAAREKFEPEAAKIAKAYAKEPYSIFISSGTLWGETFLFSMCILEEMQWVRTKSVSSADFFHGTLELVEDEVPVFIFKGIDEYRPLDERVEKFCSRFTKKLTVIDIADYELEGIDDEFKVICSPMILTSLVTERLAAHYELTTGHSLQFRRYYRQFEY